MTTTRIKGIIWDFGNILASVNHLKACRQLMRYSRVSAGDIFKMLFFGEDAPAELHEAGRISSQEFFRLVQKRVSLSEDLTYQDFSTIWQDIFQENRGVGDVIARIRPDVKMCILSNTDPIHWVAIEQLLVMKKYFSDPALLVRSYTSRTRKPDEKIYKDALGSLAFNEKNIGDVLYIEDNVEFRDAFERMGGKTLSYDCTKDALSKLETELSEFDVIQT